MAKKVSDGTITNLDIDWGCDETQDNLPFAGSEVQRFIKNQLSGLTENKIGYFFASTDTEADKRYLYGFKNEEHYQEWQEDPDTYPPSVTVDLPDAVVKITTYEVTIASSAYDVYMTNGQASIDLTIYGQQLMRGSNEPSDYEQTGTLTVQVSGGAKKTFNGVQCYGYSDANKKPYTLDLRQFAQTNTTVTLTITWRNTNDGASRSIKIKLTQLDLNLSLSTNFASALTPNSRNTKLVFGVTGNVSRIVYLYLGDSYSEKEATAVGDLAYHYVQQVGPTTQNTTFAFDKGLKAGVYKCYAWAEATLDSSDETIKTSPLQFQIIAYDSASGLQIVLNNVASSIKNWGQNHICDYSIFGQASSLKFVFWSQDYQKKYFTYNQGSVNPQQKISLDIQMEVELETANATIPMVLRVYPGNVDDTKITSSSQNYISELACVLDNSDNFAATKVGTDGFILNPKLYTNGDNQKRLVNNALDAGQDGYEVISASDPNGYWDNMDWINGGWTTDDANSKCLRIMAGSQLTIPFEDVLNNNATSEGWTMEFDVAFRNCSDDEEAVIQACLPGDESHSNPYGWVMYPNNAAFYTQLISAGAANNEKGRDVLLDYDLEYCQDTRTHIALNIYPNYSLTYTMDYSNSTYTTTINIARLFVNGIINREFIIDKNDTIKTVQKIVIGSPYCDVDVYSIRIYPNTQITTKEIQDDYLYSLPSIEEKKNWKAKNDICKDGSTTIDYEKARKQYNVLLHTGQYMSLDLANGQATEDGNTSLEILYLTDQKDAEGNYVLDTHNSAYITHLKESGQGSTAKTYYKWNGSWKVSDKSELYSYNLDGTLDNDNPLSGDNVGYQFFNYDDSTDEYKAITPLATKLVGKLNYASSMQSHKEGSLRMFEDLKAQMNANKPNKYPKSVIQQTKGFGLARTSVYQEPFLLFTRKTEDDVPTFYGLMTWGPGKGDKATFGVQKPYKNVSWIGGAEQNAYVALCFVPWLNDEVVYDETEEVWRYNKMDNFDDEMGKNTNYKDGQLQYIRDFFNFMFMHSHKLRAWSGSSMPTKDEDPSFYPKEETNSNGDIVETPQNNMLYQYWVAGAGGKQYNVYYYDYLTKSWVDAGIEVNDVSGTSVATRTTYNLLTALNIKKTELEGKTLDEQNLYFRQKRAEDLRNHISEYADLGDILQNFCFTLFIAASDNLCKNSYWYTDGVAEIDEDGKVTKRPKIRTWRDDDDTIFRINNYGQKDKPYYVEYHTKHPGLQQNADTEEDVYFTASRSAYYGTLYYAYHEDFIERPGLKSDYAIQAVMNDMITAMSNLGSNSLLANDTDYDGVLGCFNKYYFAVQNYFPAVAYNETTRLLYEEAEAAATDKHITLSYNTSPLTMAMGDSLQGEMQFLKMRIFFMKTFAMYRTPNYSLAGSLDKSFSFTITASAHMYIYADKNEGQYNQEYPIRLMPGDTSGLTISDFTQGSTFRVYDTKYMKSLGDLSSLSFKNSPSLAIDSNTMTDFIGGNADASKVQFNPLAITKLPVSLEKLDLRNVTSFTGTLDLTKNIRLKEILLDGSGTQVLTLPQSNNLTALTLPVDSLFAFTYNPCPKLDTKSLKLEECKKLRGITITCAKNDTTDYLGNNFAWVKEWCQQLKVQNASFDTCTLKLTNVNWTGFTEANLLELIEIQNAFQKSRNYSITGVITLSMSRDDIAKNGDLIMENFGENAFSEENGLYFKTDNIVAIVKGNTNVRENTTKDYKLIVTNLSFENIKSITYEVNNSSYAEIQSSGNTGCTVHFKEIENTGTTVLTATIVYTNNAGRIDTCYGTASINVNRSVYPDPSATRISASTITFDTIGTIGSFCLAGGNITADFAISDNEIPMVSEHGKYEIRWSFEDQGNSDGDTDITFQEVDGTSKTNVYKGQSISAPINSHIVQIKADIYYEGGLQTTIAKDVYVGIKWIDNFGYIYCDNGLFYPEPEDIPSGTTTPLGMVVVPCRCVNEMYECLYGDAAKGQDGYGYSRIMALNEATCHDPESSGSSAYTTNCYGTTMEGCKRNYHQGLYWGGYDTLDIPSLKNKYNVKNISGGTSSWARIGTEEQYWEYRLHNTQDKYDLGLHLSGATQTDNLWYYSTSSEVVSGTSLNNIGMPPFAGQAPYSAQTVLHYNTEFTTSGLATADMCGWDNTTKIIEQAVAQEGWENDEEPLVLSYGEGYYPAACACRKYRVRDMVADADEPSGKGGKGDWYLPAIGELLYIIPRLKYLNERLTKLRNMGYLSLPIQWSYYWSSSETSKTSAWGVYPGTGSVNPWYSKYDAFIVRPFLRA